jgi:hypothetical protein
MNKKHKAAAIAFASIVSGCGPSPDTKISVEPPIQSSGRISVTRIGVADDPIAYGHRRGIYIITDSKTGKEFIGVSGIGISETGSHSNGKNQISDER